MLKWIVRVLVVALWGASIAYAFGFGALASRYAPHLAEDSMARAIALMTLVSGGFTPCEGKEVLACGFQDSSARQQVDCADYSGERAAILMTFGQSNSANAGKDRYIPVGKVANFNFHDGKCYKAEDPLLGPDASGGSVWGVLGDKLIASGEYDSVLLIPFGIGGSSIGQWQADGFLHPILKAATAATVTKGLQPTHVLWHQGESDTGGGTSEQEYYTMFESLLGHLRDYGIGAPVFPAVATHCLMLDREPGPDYAQRQAQVRAAQQRLPDLPDVYPGPDTDTILGTTYRHDNCHFNAKGMQAHAELWLQAINAHSR